MPHPNIGIFQYYGIMHLTAVIMSFISCFFCTEHFGIMDERHLFRYLLHVI